MDQPLLFDPLDLKKVESDWKLPTHFPDLSGAKVISIDTETCDPDLLTDGPGTRRGSYIAGVSVGTDDGFREYYPVAHPNFENLDSRKVFAWLNDNLQGNQIKCGANLIYDLEFLKCAGVDVKGPTWDVQLAEPLINENQRSYSLEAIAQKYLGEGKESNEMNEWLAYIYGGKPNRKDQGGRIHKAPPALVAKYAISDVDLPLRIMLEQQKLINSMGLTGVHQLEEDLLPLMLKMRMIGVRINHNELDRVIEQTELQLKEVKKKLGGADIWSADSLQKVFAKEGIKLPKTDGGKWSVTAPWLQHHPSQLAADVLSARKLDKFMSTFLMGTLKTKLVGGRIYSQFNQLKSDEGGTISGRFSSSNPNLQFIPGRDPVLTPLIRGLFIPEDGCSWIKDDYSQVEYRIITHYGTGPSAIRAREAYRNDPRTDFHQFIADMCGIGRKPAKTINFGIAYGMGIEKLAKDLGVSIDIAQNYMDQYDEESGFVKELSSTVQNVASNRGYIKTILMRRANFDTWEATRYGQGPPLPREEAKERYGRIKRARTSTAFNRLIQGSAADIMKKAMVEIDKAGVYDVIHPPHLTVHDELDGSVDLNDKRQKEAHDEAIHIMETCVPLKVPLVVDTEIGTNWGNVE